MALPVIVCRADASEVVAACRRYADALGKDMALVCKRALMNWSTKAQVAMRDQGFGKTSRLPNLPLPGDKSRRKWRLVSWLMAERRDAGLPIPGDGARGEFSRRDLAARKSSRGFLRWMVIAGAKAAKASYRQARNGGTATARSARGIVAEAVGSIGGKSVSASMSSGFTFKVGLTRAMRPVVVESAERRIKAAFDYSVPEVVADMGSYVAQKLAERAAKEGFEPRKGARP